MMAHNILTVDKLYSKNPDFCDAMGVRKLVQQMTYSSSQPGRGEPIPSSQGLTTSRAAEKSSSSTPCRTRGKKRQAPPSDSERSSGLDKNMPVIYQESGTSSSEQSSRGSEGEYETNVSGSQSQVMPPNSKLLRPCSVHISPYQRALLRLKKQRQARDTVHRLIKKK